MADAVLPGPPGRLPAAANRLRGWALNGVTVALVALWLFPIYWLIITSFKPAEEINSPVPLFVFHPTLDNYYDLFVRFSFPHILQNSLVITGTTTVVVIVAGLFAAYALARMHIP
jgi:ABC-type glycerol-3-phosphate transport system permease component